MNLNNAPRMTIDAPMLYNILNTRCPLAPEKNPLNFFFAIFVLNTNCSNYFYRRTDEPPERGPRDTRPDPEPLTLPPEPLPFTFEPLTWFDFAALAALGEPI